ALVEHGAVLGKAPWHAEQFEVVAGQLQGHEKKGAASPRPPIHVDEPYTRNDSPQPQRSFSRGLRNLKPSFRPSRTKSSSVPSMYGRLFGSTSTLTPWPSKITSSGATSSAYSSL